MVTKTNKINKFKDIKVYLSKEGIIPLKRIKSTTNSVILCKNNEGRLVIAKIYNNKYFPRQAEYEKLIYTHLGRYNFKNIPKIYKSLTKSPNQKYNIFEYIPYKSLAQDRDAQIEKSLPKIIALFNKLHSIPIPKKLVKMHPQERVGEPIDFLKDNTISKLKRIHKTFRLQKYLDLKSTSPMIVFSHRDPNYKHIINNGKNLYFVDFEDAGVFPAEVDYASFLKDMIEYGEDLDIIYLYIKSLKKTVEEMWPYLIRVYLIDYAYSSNPTFLSFSKFQKIVETEKPLSGLGLLVKSHEISACNW